MEGKAAGCVLGREDMIVVAIITLLAVAGIGWAICAAIPKESWENEEQEEYLNEWRKKHK